MKKLVVLILISAIGGLFSSCEEIEVPEDTPSCVKRMIRKIKREEPRNPPAEVWKLTVDGSIYYYIPPHCCDQMSELYDSSCNLICHPDGGFTGQGSGNCPGLENAESELIWEDERN